MLFEGVRMHGAGHARRALRSPESKFVVLVEGARKDDVGHTRSSAAALM